MLDAPAIMLVNLTTPKFWEALLIFGNLALTELNITGNAVVAVEASAMVASHGRGKGSCGNRGGGRGGGGGRGKLWCSYLISF